MLLDDVRFMPSVDLKTQEAELEEKYAEALASEANIHTLTKIWQRIQEIRKELRSR